MLKSGIPNSNGGSQELLLRSERDLLQEFYNFEFPEKRNPDDGEIIQYEHTTSAWQDSEGDAFLILKSPKVRDDLPECWLVLYYDAQTGTVIEKQVSSVQTLKRDSYSLIHMYINNSTVDSMSSDYIIEFGVSDDYHPSKPLVLLDASPEKIRTYSHQLEGVNYEPQADSNLEHTLGRLTLLAA